MQLRGAITLLALAALPGLASAQVSVDATTSYFREAGGGLRTQSITPGVRINGTVKDRVTLQAGWEADIVSGASVAVVDAPGGDVDAVTSATEWSDQRHTATAGLGIQSERASLSGSYTFGNESDYRSHGFAIRAQAQLFERNTTFEVSYGRGFDSVCTLRQPGDQDPVDRQRLPGSDGCFANERDDRETRSLELHTLQGTWTQAWAPVFATQLTLSAQVLNGFQSNPYRAVWLGRAAAQEHHPENRVRYAAGLGLRFWLKPLKGALQIYGRAYRDTWDVMSITAELAYEQVIVSGLRFRIRGRYYNQTGAAFFSDDYTRFPRGQYFTGDRELSPMSSWVAGGRLEYDLPPGDDGNVGPFAGFALVAKFDWILWDFREFRYGNRSVPNDRGILATLGLQARF